MSEPVIRIENSGQNVEDKSMSDLSSSAIGIMVMFIMFFVVNSAGMLMDERNSGVLNRIHVSMMRRGSILLGQMLGLLFVGWIQILILILVGKYFYQIDWGNSYLGLAILFTCFLFCVSSLGTWISYIANNRTQIIGLIAIIIMPTSLLGGCMWSKDIMSDTLLKIAKFTPQSWVLDGIIGLVTRKNSLESVYRPSFVLCCFAVIFLALTYITSRYGKQR
jgi:ABC-2 type transport system permease protein